jgi:hypothetical protein
VAAEHADTRTRAVHQGRPHCRQRRTRRQSA